MMATAEWNVRLRALRSGLGWSQRQMAREFRVTPAAVSQWESGHRKVPGPVRRLVELYELYEARPPQRP
jgi:transcriptional regulator with XRE-family HTH domain